MKYKNLQAGESYSVQGNLYKAVSVLTYGRGPLFGCRFFVFEPQNSNLPELCGIQWQDGHIDRLKQYKPSVIRH